MAVMKDVAKLAGVSVSTVSFVLNGTAKEHKVADDTAQKVIKAARQLGYKMNSSANEPNALKKWQPTVAFFIPVNSVWMDMNVIHSSINRHRKQTGRDYNILLCPYETGRLTEKIDRVHISAYESAVISIENENDLKELEDRPGNSPFVIYNHSSSKYSSVSYVADEAISQAVKMISAKGCSKILVLSGRDSRQHGDEYFNLFIRCCEENGIKLSKDAFIATENTMIGGAIAARHILNMEEKPEIIICMNSTLAFGAIPLLARNHFLIPRDAELLCFGSSGDAEHIVNYIPSLSMIARPLDEITIKAFDTALRLADGKEAAPIHYTCFCDLYLHDSFSL
ncbi:MAG: LacI family DNA-binding transcriptional regulator [Ruminococcus sp.]|jgi:DNA-binding LacI/PurR family transcriptional regulator|nr:LacI family DNA-binding transcriptional regulator [Ruminococcus sp.]